MPRPRRSTVEKIIAYFAVMPAESRELLMDKLTTVHEALLVRERAALVKSFTTSEVAASANAATVEDVPATAQTEAS